jgi:hypothetical protein
MFCNHLTRMLGVLLLAGLCSCEKPLRPGPAAPRARADAEGWITLFDGKTLGGWKVTKFVGAGKVYVQDGAIHVGAGDMCTGITYDGDANDLPREDYEIELDAMRVEGVDFFCGLTFPVGKDHISLILDGWGGAVTGLSCLDDWDASLNETTQDVEFKNNRWYRIRARVTKAHILCWVDDKQIIKVARKGRRISVRIEVEPSIPLGIATWQTHGAARGIRLRRLPAEEAAETP